MRKEFDQRMLVNMTNMNYGHLTLFDDALNEWLQKMNNYCEMRAAYTPWGKIMFKMNKKLCIKVVTKFERP